MKLISLIALMGLSISAFAQEIKLNPFQWTMTDVASRGLTKEALFKGMDTEFVKTNSSICSNRALMWANDFKRDHNLDTGKIFIFFTEKKNDDVKFKVWWYHVAPVINESGNIWVVDAGFQGRNGINEPRTKEDWMKYFNQGQVCREIKPNETELIELMFSQQTYPKYTAYGNHPCYYMIVPHTIWTPNVLAQSLLGKDSSGKPVRVERPAIVERELMEACVEAASGKIGRVFGSSKKKCEEYVAK
ncbi:protein-glutamine glutaminase family protein [Peredibacter starrii]|uniref:Protein-glutamine glutaminase family protein n=1 Tax=Peredibacter starrii TaxID=28202 RepID=A0AAX4HNG3_9BACT|nr:protein-glutamine glutaminase family protein [Peredibacter starrii]WPU64840.1 protein-glutamine glutaminase family protein [Peredibacter starrii]